MEVGSAGVMLVVITRNPPTVGVCLPQQDVASI